MSQEELKNRTTQVMKVRGANYHFQAQFYEATSHDVVGSRDPKFCTLQPKVKKKAGDPAWTQAYEFVYNFLQKAEMDLTLRTLSVEFGRGGEPRRAGTFDRQDRDAYFAELRQLRRLALEDEVRDFAEGGN
jgi:hypothetical protein